MASICLGLNELKVISTAVQEIKENSLYKIRFNAMFAS